MKTSISLLWLLLQQTCTVESASPPFISPAVSSSTKKLPIRKHRFGTLKKQMVPKDKRSTPVLLKPWIVLYRAFPRVTLLFTDIDVAFTLVSALLFTGLDYSIGIAFAKGAKWPKKERRAAAGSITTIFHSCVLVTGLFECLRTEKYSPSGGMDVHPPWWQDATTALIQFCTGYMLYDAIVQFIVARWVPGAGPVLGAPDWLFLGHHAGTAFYMTSSRLIQAGHMSAMSLMLFGELTAPIMNLLRLCKLATSIDAAPWLQAIRPVVEYVFACLYVIVRVIVGPMCAVHLTYDIALTKQGRKNVPIQLSIVWLILVWGVLFGSLPWIRNALSIMRTGHEMLRWEGS